MRGSTRLWMTACAAAVVWSAAATADPIAEQRKAQNKLLAHRAARADAVRKLAERIRGLRITSTTTVRDFVTESDVIDTSMVAYLTGMKEVGRPRYMEDGTCELVMEITIREVVTTLKQLHTRHYKGNKVKIKQLDQITVRSRLKVLRETGTGALRATAPLADAPLAEVRPGEALASVSNMTPAARAYWKAHCTGQGRLMAVRAARNVAMRRLAERIRGVRITSQTIVRDFVAESDQINVDMRAFLRGFRETGIRYHEDELIVEVDLTVTLRELLVNLKAWGSEHYKGNKVRIKQLTSLKVRTRDKFIRETGMGIPPERFLKQVAPVGKRVMALAVKAPAWATRPMHEQGNAALDTDNPNKAQAKLMAYRGAELDARRKLAEKIRGLKITASTTVRDFVTAHDEIATCMRTFQQGAYVLDGSKKLLDDGTAQVIVVIELKPLWNMVLHFQRKLSITIR